MMKRFCLNISGCVQGVGFRPFIYRLAHLHHLVGSILNTNRGVQVDIQGKESHLKAFHHDLFALKPKLAEITEIERKELPLHQADSFHIHTSEAHSEPALSLLPDSALCLLCLQELFDPQNRRYQYPFLHCTHCGPRFSLFERTPFDRAHTSMRDFEMCQECRQEYSNPEDRRFYSQTNCCPACGPTLRLLNPQQEELAKGNDVLPCLIESLKKGQIIAMKNTGGYLLLADATDEKAVRLLRIRKKREKKPFAILMENLSLIQQIAFVDSVAESLLTSAAAPIVLLKKRSYNLALSVTCESPYYGIMLPHTPLQHLLLRGLGKPLVATSGNLSHYPLCITEEEAFEQLPSIADLFLIHNRRIVHRLDDSVVHIISDKAMILRKARGYIPYACHVTSFDFEEENILGVGGHQKNSFAFYKKKHIYMSQHLGDLDSVPACHVYDQEVKNWQQLLNVPSYSGVGDPHPDYYTSLFLQNQDRDSSSVQHHKAHALSCMLDNQLPPQPLTCISWDGTGWGDDSTIWGGEAFHMSVGLGKRSYQGVSIEANHKEEKSKTPLHHSLHRFASLYSFRLPGGEKAVLEPRRSALGTLHVLFGEAAFSLPWVTKAFTNEECRVLVKALSKGIHSPLCSSMGRLFDAVSALLDCCFYNSYEGEAALVLEAAALSAPRNKDLPLYKICLIQKNDLWLLDWRPLFHQILNAIAEGIPRGMISLAFHFALADGIVQIAHAAASKKILLTGGVMQNKLLVECAIVQLRKEGFEPFWHHRIPPNDGGLAAGQIMGKALCV